MQLIPSDMCHKCDIYVVFLNRQHAPYWSSTNLSDQLIIHIWIMFLFLIRLEGFFNLKLISFFYTSAFFFPVILTALVILCFYSFFDRERERESADNVHACMHVHVWTWGVHGNSTSILQKKCWSESPEDLLKEVKSACKLLKTGTANAPNQTNGLTSVYCQKSNIYN